MACAKDFLKSPVKHMKISRGMSVSDMVAQFSGSGAFAAGRIADAADIYEAMLKDEDCTVMLGLAGALVPAGFRELIRGLIEDGMIDVLVTTGANMTHDLFESIGHHHYKGNPFADDVKLNEMEIDRVYDVFLSNKVYCDLEDFVQPVLKEIYAEMQKEKKSVISARELMYEIGGRINDPNSIIKTAHDKNVPILCCTINDCGLGNQIAFFKQNKEFHVDQFEDYLYLVKMTWDSKKTGAIFLGGGVPKNQIMQALQFSDKEHSYAIQITTDRVEPGGSSGAALKEGISWGKLNKDTKYSDIRCDATVAFPLIVAAVRDRIGKKA